MTISHITALIAVCVLACAARADDAVPMTPKTAALLENGQEPVTVACFGDSITGVYYHTGGVRAYTDMLGIALKRIYPQGEISMVNAGISGNTTAAGLQRIERDVLSRNPQLVTIMFGMNDVTGTPAGAYRANLESIVEQCRGVGAEVVLCTPNSVYPEDAGRPMDKLGAFAQTVRDLGAELGVPVADCWQAYEDIRAEDPLAWKLLMSETIHPNMNGHKVFAKTIARTISGLHVALDDIGPPTDGLSHTLGLVDKGKPIRIVATPPFDRIVKDALLKRYPEATVEAVTWPTEGKTLAEIEMHAHTSVGWGYLSRHPDERRPDLVAIAIPAELTDESEEAYIRRYSWVLNWSLHFGLKQWDCVAVLPEVLKPALTDAERPWAALARRVAEGQDISIIERPAGNGASAEEIVEAWVDRQIAARQFATGN